MALPTSYCEGKLKIKSNTVNLHIAKSVINSLTVLLEYIHL